MFQEKAVESVHKIERTHVEIEKVLEDFRKVQKLYMEEVESVSEEVQDEINAIKKDETLDDAAKEKKIKPIVERGNENIKKVEKDTGYDKAKEEVLEVVIQSNERFDLLKQLFSKMACDIYVRSDALSTTFEALESAKEA